jgi:hypothetical protein
VATLTSFVRDLELHRKIASGDFDEIDGVRVLNINHPYHGTDEEDEIRDGSIDEYRRLVQTSEVAGAAAGRYSDTLRSVSWQATER